MVVGIRALRPIFNPTRFNPMENPRHPLPGGEARSEQVRSDNTKAQPTQAVLRTLIAPASARRRREGFYAASVKGDAHQARFTLLLCLTYILASQNVYFELAHEPGDRL
ncbi:hypothetical protein GQ53DRAFT_33406 [Thozetella sp. PMI_491]|nr:hypothetical protein GQ53DRAFT_33406 [Thozetella sp. PMI_491]